MRIPSTQPYSAGKPAYRAFVGREHELAELNTGLADAFAGRSRLLLLTGEAGIGKTRLADQFAGHARGRGAIVLWGRCWEGGGAPAYWPWLRMIRSYARQTDNRTLADQLGVTAPYVAHIVTELHQRIPNLPVPPKLENEDARFALFDALAEFLANVSRATPLVLILDDLHEADRPSLLLARFVAHELREAHVFMLGIFRDVEARLSPQTRAVLDELASEGTRLALRGFTSAEVARFIESTSERTPSAALVQVVHQTTEGNPLFLEEIVRLLAADGRLGAEGLVPGSLKIPDKVREVIGRRLALLANETRCVLESAAVLGRDFDLSLLAAVTGVSQEELVTVIAEAAATGILSNLPGALGRASFCHALFRESLYDGIPQPRRAMLHRDAGEALEKLHAADLEPHLAELAHHFSEAPRTESARAVNYGMRAGDRAMSLFAYEEALQEYRRAVSALRRGQEDQPRLCELLLRLGNSQWRTGEHVGAREIFLRAADLARKLHSPTALAGAALGYGAGAPVEYFLYQPEQGVIGLLDEANEALSDGDSPLRVRVLSRLALELYWTNDSQRVEDLSRQAVEMAERLGDREAELAATYTRCQATWGPDTVERALVSADEVVRLAGEVGDREMMYLGREIRLRALLQLGEATGADLEAQRCAKLADDLRVVAYRKRVQRMKWMRAVADGRLEEALEAAARVEPGNAPLILGILWWLGRLDGLESLGLPTIERYPLQPGWRAALAATLGELGRVSEARAEFEQLASRDFSTIPRNDVWLSTMYYLARACAWVRDGARAQSLYELLAPYANQFAVLANGGSFGSVHAPLGLLAATAGRWQEAIEHFERAIERNRATGNKPMTAITIRDYAAALVRRAAREDGGKALALFDEAIGMMRAMAMEGHAARAEAGRSEAQALAPTSEWHAELVRGERYWTLAAGNETHRLKDVKGLGYLAELLRHPYREFHVAELVALAATDVDSAAAIQRDELLTGQGLRVGGLAHGEDLLDREAKAAYRRRLAELEGELEEARRWNDPPRASRAEHEIEAITRELEASIGLGGRSRRAASPAERARINVTKSIRAAIERIAEACPDIGTHLSSAVRTGAVCMYFPDPASAISWRL
jgi:tetratricopeptide (TPR) repeat protein